MLSYETLDAIADSYTPVLAVIALALIAVSAFKLQWKLTVLRLCGFCAVAVVAYGLMFLDITFTIWPHLGLDYSTHTAVAIGLVVFLSFEINRSYWYWTLSFICYALLMLYQHYHSVGDIVTTSVAVGIPLAIFFSLFQKDRLFKEEKELITL